MNKRKIYVVGDSYEYANWMQGKLTKVMEEADLVVFTGGTDVDSELYGEKRNLNADYPDKKRDKKEVEEFNRAVLLKKHIISVCRGSQLTCVLNGGRLVQHQEHQPHMHPITTIRGNVVMATSTHHQAQYPFELEEGKDYKLIGWTQGLSSYHLDGEGNEMNPPKEAEIVFYPITKCLAIQSHPEYMIDHPDIEFYKDLLNTFIDNRL